jgi:hypothetical protein
MKTFLLGFALLLPHYSQATDWKTPPVLCPEEALPQGVACLDLSRVENPNLDYPAGMSEQDIRRWSTTWSKDLKVCRSREILRRETINPGSFTALQIQIAWMTSKGGENSQRKLQKIIESSQTLGMPAQILVGAFTQESLLAELGIASDGGNFSCGIGQLNISEWCLGMGTISAAERTRLAWPNIACNLLPSNIVEPFYNIALRRLNGRPEYRLDATDFAGITQQDVQRHFPTGDLATQTARFQAVKSFVANCQDSTYGIPFKARNIKQLFDRYVPAKMKNSEVYSIGERYSRSCSQVYASRFYPLHTGWLLALAAYNAGPAIAKMLEHYHQAPAQDIEELHPDDLIEALYWGGEIRSTNNRVYFTSATGQSYSQSWYKSCVVQRHVARVVQHVTAPGSTIVRSLEPAACSQVPPVERRSSRGIKI